MATVKKSASDRKKAEKPSIPGLLLKIALIPVLGLFVFSLWIAALNSIEDFGYDRDESNKVNACDYSYYRGEYGELEDYLELYSLYSDTYDVYWEIVDGYEDYMQWLSYSRYAAEQAAYYAEKVKQNAENCRFDRNRKELEKLAKLVTD